ncbi:hypothetical protein MCC02031_06650 [Bifidobacteriaceae bacterium MCC02031]|nr:hypothetical protein MCC02031_06650 [Bifidobacteriaceae bacterium MCC02031]
MADNSSLSAARSAKNDEFYTQYSDIEAEMNAYVEYNPDVFRGKTVLLPCDDPEWSNFTKYFAANFTRFGLRKLISTSYAQGAGNRQMTLFELNSPLYDESKHETHGKLFTLASDTDGSGMVDTDDIEFSGYLEGDGDFRSDEVKRLRDEADIIITNPPFSLFREFLAWILEADKKFVILGNMNAITYKEVFPHLQNNAVWLGYKSLNQDMYFNVTDEYKQWLLENKKEGSAYKVIGGVVMGRLASACWFTNLDHGKRHEKMILDTMAHNLKFNKKLKKKLEKDYGKVEYPHYDNYDAIEVPLTECIPSDYEAAMGVPITFLDKWNADQFEIVGADFSLANPEPLPDGKTGTGRFYVRVERVSSKALVLALGHSEEEMTRALLSMGVSHDEMTWESGVMGVPITFMDKYNPDQFEIVAFRKGDDGKDLVFTREREYNRTFASLYNVDSGDDKERRRKDKWTVYLRENNNHPQMEPVDMFHPLCITSRAKGTMNGTVNGQETYRRILVIRKGGN